MELNLYAEKAHEGSIGVIDRDVWELARLRDDELTSRHEAAPVTVVDDRMLMVRVDLSRVPPGTNFIKLVIER